jgi:hypothetical protein
VGLVCWFAFAVMVGGLLFLGTLGALVGVPVQVQGEWWLGLGGPPGLVAFGVGLVCFGRYLARDEAEFLRAFLVEALQARAAGGRQVPGPGDINPSAAPPASRGR